MSGVVTILPSQNKSKPAIVLKTVHVVQLTRLDPHDAWLPITESRNGNPYSSAFHSLFRDWNSSPCSPCCLYNSWVVLGNHNLDFSLQWQLYTLYLLLQLHESTETGMRYSKYMQLCSVTLDVSKMARYVPRHVPIRRNMHHLDHHWGPNFWSHHGFRFLHPDLNFSAVEGKMTDVSYNPVRGSAEVTRIFDVFNALGIIDFAFRGQNLILEIQVWMLLRGSSNTILGKFYWPSWRDSIAAYCIYPLGCAVAELVHLELEHVNIFKNNEQYQSIPSQSQQESSKERCLKKISTSNNHRQAPRAWNTRIDTYFMENGFKKCPYEHALYAKKNGGNVLFVALYVDDLIFMGNNDEMIEEFKGTMTREFEMTDLGLMKFSWFGGAKLSKFDGGERVDASRYWSLVLKRILRYIQGTVSLGLFYSKAEDYKLVGYSDSDWCGDIDDRKSTSGYVFFYGRYCVYLAFKEAADRDALDV
ncbi:hypothetical protein F3Y22_tig00003403pilonHSYRG00082 [Hibiscus syriacus]|uniref:Reverse transcriptase Ty1/copia-type domain-containing protein n=1 Tax=Hibiscus syriacus TaxID=106335 RepID=A0A6A3CQ59_HIBSY|nr:hypothetical protein F3Y22_tig00003403pilonHSYRG00082 [Hibiscus syriacus]